MPTRTVAQMSTDWRLPENRREGFQRLYSFHLKYKSHPGCVYALLPYMVEQLRLDADQMAWLVWLNGNTQNPVMSYLLLEAAPTHHEWYKAVEFWNDNFKLLDWDTDRRHQKSKFGEATEKWYLGLEGSPAEEWNNEGAYGWDAVWKYAFDQPYMGRLSAWSMIEYARILFGSFFIPDAKTLLLDDVSGSCSHRNGLAVVAGYDAAHWEPGTAKMIGIVDELKDLGESLLIEALNRNENIQEVSRLTLESALCTSKSQWKPDRRYPNCYADMTYDRIKKAEARFGRTLDIFWDARREHLPVELRLEDNPLDPGLAPVKQNWFREHGTQPMVDPEFQEAVASGAFGERKEKSWK